MYADITISQNETQVSPTKAINAYAIRVENEFVLPHGKNETPLSVMMSPLPLSLFRRLHASGKPMAN
ncbi:hypothetical protein SAMN05444487_107105 [Marininema mesophilum]|uniref:Uncharacterized protein n=1 Tax=Marininema mesophilum TaxID=1048340 RepID=A0A1H2X6K8_9BACL|nr:hypothetical protein SAMN05444487_107105 [Marininema mesophilum]